MTNGDPTPEARAQVSRDFQNAQAAVQNLVNSMQAVFDSAETVVDDKLDEWHDAVSGVIEKLNEVADAVREKVANVNWHPPAEETESEEPAADSEGSSEPA